MKAELQVIQAKKLGIDAGNHELKIAGESGVVGISAILGEFRERNLEESFSDSDIIFHYKDRKGFAGKLAEMESEFAGSLFGTTKAHEDTLIRVLLAIASYGGSGHHYDIVVGQPIEQHKKEEKQLIKDMLIGEHEIEINGQLIEIFIDRCEVAAEGGVAFWSAPRKGRVRILDFGSGTVNGATLVDGKYIDRDSFTTEFGLSTIKSLDRQAFVRAVYIETQKKRWQKSDPVFVIGGASDEMLPFVQHHFDIAELMKPQIRVDGDITNPHPKFANAIGMYNVAKGLFK